MARGVNRFPCISEYGGKLYAVWQRQNGSNYDIYFATSQNGGSSWAAPYVLASTSAAQDPLPVIQANVTAQTSIVVAFYNGSNLRSYSTTNVNPGSGNWSSKTVTGTGSGSLNPSLAACALTLAYLLSNTLSKTVKTVKKCRRFFINTGFKPGVNENS